MKIVISSGHGKYIPGAVGIINEHQEAVRVVNAVAAQLDKMLGVEVVTFEDTTSRDQNTNLKTIVNFHNSQTRDLDVSVHFNCYQNTSKPMGTECLYYSQEELADEVAGEISLASNLIDRGPKKRTDLYFLNKTEEPAILIEVCFVDSSADVALYQEKFDAICEAIAEAISGEELEPPGPTPPPEPIEKPDIHKGDDDAEFVQPYVSEAQTKLNNENNAGLYVDGDFGSLTDTATRNYQRSRGLGVDGWIGQETWAALDSSKPPLPPPPGLPPVLSAEAEADIKDIAATSAVAGYSWDDRGRMAVGYTSGVALSFANAYRQWLVGYQPAVEMAKANTGNADKDVLSWEKGRFDAVGMDNSKDGADTLRHLWVYILGLGVRESSGEHCCGRDESVPVGYYGPPSDTTEAGAWQTSWDAHTCSSHFDTLFDAFSRGGGNNPQGFLEAFKEGVSCSSSQWACYGGGQGYQHQEMSKYLPAYAAEVCAIALRNLRKHYGPVGRREVEILKSGDLMLREVQEYVDNMPVA